MSLVNRYSRDFSGNLVLDPEGSWVLAADAAIRDKRITDKLAAETLRADTAEARVKTAEHDLEFFKSGKNEQFDRAEAAEQRGEELFGLLEHAYGAIENSKEWRWLIDRIDAALNPKPEAGSHE